MKKYLFLLLMGLCVMPAYAQLGFGDHLMNCKSNDGKKAEIFIGDDFITSNSVQRRKMRKQGMVGMLWDSDFYNSDRKMLNKKIVWAKPKKLSDTSYLMGFPGYVPFVFKLNFTEQSFKMNGPFVILEENGGKVWECGVDLEMLNKGY